MNNIRIMLTSVGGLVVPSMIESLRNYFENIYIVGVDASEDAVGFHFTNSSYLVPYGNDPNYFNKILEIVKKESIDFIIPLSDEETIALAKKKDYLINIGVKALCSDYNICKIAFNKGKMLNFLKQNDIETPKYRIPKNNDELLEYAKELGYPEKKIVFKPNFSRGARGFWLLDKNYDEIYGLLRDRNRQTTTLNRIHNILSQSDEFPSILLMEYLEGDDFNIDVLAKNGKCYFIIPNKRLVPKAGPVRVGLVQEDKKIYRLVKRIVNVFQFDYCLNIEVAYNKEIQKPMIYEINARVGAPIVINAAAGINLLAKAIELANGVKIEKNQYVQETKMIRYWNELFVKKEKYFKS